MALTQQRFNEQFPRDFAQVFIVGVRDHFQRLVSVIRQTNLNGAKVERHGYAGMPLCSFRYAATFCRRAWEGSLVYLPRPT